MFINKISEDLEDLVTELKCSGFSIVPDKIPTITKTLPWVSLNGDVATIRKRGKDYVLTYRNIKPIYKGNGKYEYRVTIDGNTHAVHKLLAITYPAFTGCWTKDMDIHHIDGNHLNNAVTNLICLEKDVHQEVHYLLKTDARERVIEYLKRHITYDNIVTLKDLEELKYGEV